MCCYFPFQIAPSRILNHERALRLNAKPFTLAGFPKTLQTPPPFPRSHLSFPVSSFQIHSSVPATLLATNQPLRPAYVQPHHTETKRNGVQTKGADEGQGNHRDWEPPCILDQILGCSVKRTRLFHFQASTLHVA